MRRMPNVVVLLALGMLSVGCARVLGPAPEPVFVIAPYADPATNPAVQARVVTGRNEQFFIRRHNRIQQRIAEQETIDLLFAGDSIMQFWEARYSDLFEEYYGHRNPINFGISSDQTENVLWRIENTDFGGKQPKAAVVLIGTNNIGNSNHTAAQTADGVIATCRALRVRFPEMKILLLAIFPRADKGPGVQAQVEAANAMIEPIGDERWIFYRDLSDVFLADDGTLPADTFPDRLHPGLKGYEIWAEAIEPDIARLLGE